MMNLPSKNSISKEKYPLEKVVKNQLYFRCIQYSENSPCCLTWFVYFEIVKIKQIIQYLLQKVYWVVLKYINNKGKKSLVAPSSIEIKNVRK